MVFSVIMVVIITTIPVFYERFAFRLVLAVAVSDFISEFLTVLGHPDNEYVCRFQSFVNTFGGVSSVLWVAVVSYCIYRITVIQDYFIHHYEVQFHLFCWFASLILALLPFSTESYGDIGVYCWIKDESTIDKIWRISSFYGPLWITI
eukprot:UN28440